MSRKDLEFHELLSQQYQIATQILGARKKRNLTQLELAQLSGVQQADISRIENGQSFPTTETLAKLLLALQAKVKIEVVSKVLTSPGESRSNPRKPLQLIRSTQQVIEPWWVLRPNSGQSCAHKHQLNTRRNPFPIETECLEKFSEPRTPHISGYKGSPRAC